MWAFLPLTAFLLFSTFTATNSEEKQDAGKGAVVRARLEVCQGPHLQAINKLINCSKAQ